MLALFLLMLVPVMMWGGQSILLLAIGRPMSWRISSADLPRKLQSVNRAITQTSFAFVLIADPFIRGEQPLRYYLNLLPVIDWPLLVYGLLISILYLSTLYLGWLITDNVRFEIRHKSTRFIQRILVAPFSAIFGALVEELLFRAMLLNGLLESFSIPVALTLGAFIFAAAHYVRQVKRYWTFAGHIGLGLLLCTAFVCTRSLWLSLGLHAGGILIITSFRPFLRYNGPRWLVGASVFPYAGVVGIVALMLLTLNIWLALGG